MIKKIFTSKVDKEHHKLHQMMMDSITMLFNAMKGMNNRIVKLEQKEPDWSGSYGGTISDDDDIKEKK